MSSTSSTDDGLEFLRKMWGNMGFNLPGMVTPTLDVDELDKRIGDMRAVEGWLKMNLGMLQMTIQGLEVQRAALAAMRTMSETQGPGGDAAAMNPFANPALWAWPFASSSGEQPSSPEQTPSQPAPSSDSKPRKGGRSK